MSSTAEQVGNGVGGTAHPSRTPVPKVAASGVAGAVTVVLVWALGAAGLDMPVEVAQALTVILSFGAGYLKA
jgi:hypothetical protein